MCSKCENPLEDLKTKENIKVEYKERFIEVPSFLINDYIYEEPIKLISPRCTCANCMTTEEIYDQCDNNNQSTCTCNGESNMGCGQGCSESGGGGGHSHSWIEKHGVWNCTSSRGHQWYKKCSGCKEEVGMGIYKSGVTSWRYDVGSSTTCKKYGDCDHCGKRYYEYPNHSFGAEFEENGWIKQKCRNCGYDKLISQVITPSISSFTASPTTTDVSLSVRATNANQYYYALWQGSSLVGESGYVSSTSYSFSSLQPLTSYRATVQAKNSSNGKYDSSTVNFTTTSYGKVPAPKLRVVKTTPTQIDIYWDVDLNKVGSLRVTCIESSISGWENGYTLNFSASYPNGFTQLDPNTQYKFRAKSLGKNGWEDSDYGVTLYASTMAYPNVFSWANTVSVGSSISDAITATKWRELQDTVNAWRGIYALSQYERFFTTTSQHAYSTASKGDKITALFYNQVCNAMNEIPPIKNKMILVSVEQVMTASQFNILKNTINSLRS